MVDYLDINMNIPCEHDESFGQTGKKQHVLINKTKNFYFTYITIIK